MPISRAITMYYLFQSLIGRLKTKTAVDEVREMIEFQSLIGRLKTPIATTDM